MQTTITVKVNEQEVLKKFNDEQFAKLDAEFKRDAVQMLRATLPAKIKEKIRADHAQYGVMWIHDGELGHFSFGMHVRNFLRQNGFRDELTPTGNLDDCYIPLLEAACDLREL